MLEKLLDTKNGLCELTLTLPMPGGEGRLSQFPHVSSE